METVGAIAIWAILWGFIGFLIGSSKNQEISGVVWGALFGPIGLLIVLALPKKDRPDFEA